MRPPRQEPLRLGGGHCCVCATTCNHIGPIRLCQHHWLEGKQVRFPDDPLVPDRRDAEGVTLGEYLATVACQQPSETVSTLAS